jgi:prepilin peptidase CpaA
MGFPIMAVVLWPASLVLLLVAAATDLKDRRIPDEVAIAIAAIGLAQGLLVRAGSLWLSLVVASVVFCGLAVLSHHRIIGGGDVKLVSAATLLVPPTQVGQLLIDIALAGGVLGCLYLVARLVLRTLPTPAVSPITLPSGFIGAINTERRRIAAGGPMPYALAILGGACLYAANEFVSCSSALSCLW